MLAVSLRYRVARLSWEGIETSRLSHLDLCIGVNVRNGRADASGSRDPFRYRAAYRHQQIAKRCQRTICG